jgi:hypothetical protein
MYEHLHPQEILAMKQRVKEMEEEAAKLRELQAAAAAASASSDPDANGEGGVAGETEEERAAADERSVYVGNVRPTLLFPHGQGFWSLATSELERPKT